MSTENPSFGPAEDGGYSNRDIQDAVSTARQTAEFTPVDDGKFPQSEVLGIVTEVRRGRRIKHAARFVINHFTEGKS